VRPKRFFISLTAILAISAVTIFATTAWAATEKVLYSFSELDKDGSTPRSGLTADAVGNLYGTTAVGGTHGYGTVFMLTPKTGGGWTEKILYNFLRKFPSAYSPEAGLIIDAAGNLYGTTESGGSFHYGTVFELTPKAGGGWTENVLHSFNNNRTDGANPMAGLIFDAAGNLYGTTELGGTSNTGTVFELTPAAGGSWTEKVLHSFNNNGDGTNPTASLIFDASGNLYGTTELGGTSNYGTVFELTSTGAEKILHSFNGADGSIPSANLISDVGGNLYGTTRSGGTSDYGTVFELTPAAGGSWTEKVLHHFSARGTDGNQPWSGLILDAAGNLYGTTEGGGTHSHGTVFELTPKTGGGWTEKVLHSFVAGDGSYPEAGLIFDAAGKLYSTTISGGTYNLGTVFELAPKAGGGWTEMVLHSFVAADGFWPFAGVIFDAAGDLYGTAEQGGATSRGTVFELKPKVGGGWTEQVLNSFAGPIDEYPWAGLIFDAAGNLYGTTSGFGDFAGTVFELTPTAGGVWTENVLHSFNNNGQDGAFPYAGLVFDGTGNLYGATTGGGTYYQGTVFEMMPKAGGGWTETVLHSFNNNGTDGYSPWGGLTIDALGNLYGTTAAGGAYNQGTIFELTPTASGSWTETLLHSFNDNGTDGSRPYDTLIFDASGNLYGATELGGTYNHGAVFELTPKVGGGWTEKVLHSFDENGVDGYDPWAGLVLDAAGNLYGTTLGGGASSCGVVFKLTPASGGSWTEKIMHSFTSEPTDGCAPRAGLTFDASGNIYGTTNAGGANGGGTVFEITP
jgi:uncharacterized repeat protein (TIGR03803 family)